MIDQETLREIRAYLMDLLDGYTNLSDDEHDRLKAILVKIDKDIEYKDREYN